jgi:tRNA(Ile)-lysidine synthase
MMRKAAVAIASRLGIELRIEEVEVGDGPSPEEQARVARYSALTRVESTVVTGHTRDDSAETMLINLVRGTGSPGLTGIPRFRPPNVYRPILALTRGETREIAALAALPFADDPMNDDMSLTRNRVRLAILPRLRELNPQVEAALARTATLLERDSRFLDELAPELGDSRSVPLAVVTTLPRPVADRVLRAVLVASGVGPTADRIERMWSVASGQSERQDLADGRVATTSGALLVVE